MKLWRCRNGHALGLAMRVNKSQRLLLFRQAAEVVCPDENLPEILAVISGYARDVRCTLCGCRRTWYPDAKEELNVEVEEAESL